MAAMSGLLFGHAANAQNLSLKMLVSELTAPIHLEEWPDGSGRMLFIGLGDSGASHGIGKTVIWEAFNVSAEALHWDKMAQGKQIQGLQGKLLIADWSASFKQASGQLFVATPNTPKDKLWALEKLIQIDSRIISLSEDRSGEIYVLTHEGMGPFGNTGKVYQLVTNP